MDKRVPYIIAEAGSCHEDDFPNATELIFFAAKADADAVKFQYWSSPQRMRQRRQIVDPNAYEIGSIREAWFDALRTGSHRYGLDFMCTAYLPEDIPVVAEYVDAFKVSSFEATPGFILLHDKWARKLVYISTGLLDVEEADRLPGSFNFRYLHCVSGYPVPVAEANLAGISTADVAFDGYSDHTRNVLTGAVAVGAGAQVLEVHFRLDDTSPSCPDYCVSLSPEELRQYIANARLAHVLMGDGIKRVMPSEGENVKHKVTEV